MEWFVKLLDDLVAESAEVPVETLQDIEHVRNRLAASIGHLPRHPRFDVLMEKVEAAETMDQAAAAFAQYPREFGFEDATLVVTNEGQRRCLNRRVLSSLPAEWWEAYHAQNLHENDPVLAAVASGCETVFLDTLIPPPPAPMRYLKAAQALDLGVQGVVFRVEYASGLIAVVVLNTHRDATAVRTLYERWREDLHRAAEAFCDALVHFSTIGAPSEQALTSEEIRFLRLVVTSEDPSAALKMRCRYGTPATLQAAIMRKLGVKSIFQAVAMALRSGLLDSNVFDVGEIVATRPRMAGWELA